MPTEHPLENYFIGVLWVRNPSIPPRWNSPHPTKADEVNVTIRTVLASDPTSEKSESVCIGNREVTPNELMPNSSHTVTVTLIENGKSMAEFSKLIQTLSAGKLVNAIML